MTLNIRNWSRWQSYRSDRGQPPWIKVHRQLMRDPNWVALTDAQRGQLVAIWLLAADRDGVIPASPELVGKLCYMDATPDLQVFVRYGFIEPDANMTPQRRQHDVPETETEAETETETDNPPVVPPRGDARKSKAKRATQLPTDWQPTDEHHKRANREGVNLEREVEKFRAHAEATGRTLKNWNAGFTTWLLNAKQFDRGRRDERSQDEWMDREIERFRQKERARDNDGPQRLHVDL